MNSKYAVNFNYVVWFARGSLLLGVVGSLSVFFPHHGPDYLRMFSTVYVSIGILGGLIGSCLRDYSKRIESLEKK